MKVDEKFLFCCTFEVDELSIIYIFVRFTKQKNI